MINFFFLSDIIGCEQCAVKFSSTCQSQPVLNSLTREEDESLSGKVNGAQVGSLASCHLSYALYSVSLYSG